MDTSPDGSTVVSAATDETLMFWDVFGLSQKRGKGMGYDVPGLLPGMPNIR